MQLGTQNKASGEEGNVFAAVTYVLYHGCRLQREVETRTTDATKFGNGHSTWQSSSSTRLESSECLTRVDFFPL